MSQQQLHFNSHPCGIDGASETGSEFGTNGYFGVTSASHDPKNDVFDIRGVDLGRVGSGFMSCNSTQSVQTADMALERNVTATFQLTPICQVSRYVLRSSQSAMARSVATDQGTSVASMGTVGLEVEESGVGNGANPSPNPRVSHLSGDGARGRLRSSQSAMTRSVATDQGTSVASMGTV